MILTLDEQRVRARLLTYVPAGATCLSNVPLHVFEDRFNASEHCTPLTFENSPEMLFETTSLGILEPCAVVGQDTVAVSGSLPMSRTGRRTP
jgi:hypothetical protein